MRYNDREPIYLQIISEIKAQIAYGKLESGAAFLGFSAMLLVIYLLVFQVNLNLSGLVMAPVAGLTEGFVLAGDTLLQTPWKAVWMNIILTTAALILQTLSLIYLLSGRVDVS